MIEIQNISAIVTDIEGTTTSLSFVKDVLFPHARARLPAFVRSRETELGDLLNEVRKIEKNENMNTADIIATFMRWMDEDKKITPLKLLQGMIWKEGYEKGELQGHMYEDAARALKYWRNMGLKLYVYSSGSVAAQKLLFSHTEGGDLTAVFSGYFDTTTGPKLEAASYKKIASEIKTEAGDILFLSDNPGELIAAREAGFQVILLNRENGEKGPDFRTAFNFDEIMIQEMAA